MIGRHSGNGVAVQLLCDGFKMKAGIEVEYHRAEIGLPVFHRPLDI